MKYFYLLLIIMVPFFMGCKKEDPCDDKNCPSTAVCIEGVCDCIEGYEGASCETEMRDKFLGSYTGTITETWDGGSQIIAEDATLTVVSSGVAVNKVSVNTLGEVVLFELFSPEFTFYYDELKDFKVSGKNISLSEQLIFEGDLNDDTNEIEKLFVFANGQIDGDILQIEFKFIYKEYNENQELNFSVIEEFAHELYFFKN